MPSRKCSLTFAASSAADDAIIAQVRQNYRVFRVKKKEATQPAVKWHAGNLIPSEDLVGAELATIYVEKMICWDVAGGHSEEYQRLYELVAASNVFEMWGLKRAHEW